MTLCPFCGAENIDGADVCDDCSQSLEHLSKPRRAPGVEDALFQDRVGTLVRTRPLAVDEATSVGEVIELLVRERVGCVVILRGEEVVGIFSERDALMRIGDAIERCRQRPVREFMTDSPETLDAQDKLVFALHKMDVGHFRHVPILRDGRLHGVVSVRDILRYLTDRVRAG